MKYVLHVYCQMYLDKKPKCFFCTSYSPHLGTVLDRTDSTTLQKITFNFP